MDKFIVLEGLEGSGKSTILKHIKSFFLKKKQEEIVSFREPGGTLVGNKIRDILLDVSLKNDLHEDTELLLLYASRVELIQRISFALEKKKWVISDRFYWSTFAYQGGGRNISFNKISILNKLFVNISPGLVIYLDVDPIVGLSRIRKNSLDRIEKEDIDFFFRAREVFLDFVKKKDNAYLVNSNGNLSCVKRKVIEIIDLHSRKIIENL